MISSPGLRNASSRRRAASFGKLELGRDVEDRRIRQERDQRAGVLLVLQIADDRQLLRRHAALERHVVDLPVARHLHLEPVRKRVHALRAHAVQTAGILVGALAELAARVQVRQHQLDRRDLELRMDIHRNAAAVVPDGAGAIDMDRHIDPDAMPRQMLVDRVVQHLEDAVMQTPLIGRPDIHARALPNTGKPLELVDLRSVVLFGSLGKRQILGHQNLYKFANTYKPQKIRMLGLIHNVFLP